MCLEQMTQKAKVNKAMQQKVQICGDSQIEYVLSKGCLGVNKVNHILRDHGGLLKGHSSALQSFEDDQRQVLDRLFPGLTEESHVQASMGAAVGGLGWRSASHTAVAANLGALVQAAPKIASMIGDATKAGLVTPGLLEARLDAKVTELRTALLQQLDDVESIKAQDFLTKSERAAVDSWTALTTGRRAASSIPRAAVSYASAGDIATTAVGEDADGDSPQGGGKMNSMHVQRELSRLVDCTRLRALEESLRSRCRWSQLKRLKELRDKEVSNMWLWHIDPLQGSVMTETDFVFNVQRRLGAKLLTEECTCRQCGKIIDIYAEHCEVCAIGEATKGHYAVVRAVVDGLKLADSAVTTEPVGLTDTQSRPADILTTAAVPGRSAALDVCIASPDAGAAGTNAVEAAFKRKLDHYRNVIPQLHAAGIAFRPLIWSSDGRPHPAVTRTLKFAAETVARKRGGVSVPNFLSRWKHEIQIAILRRRAAMFRATQPKVGAKDAWLLTGVPGDGDGEGGVRLEEIEEEDLLAGGDDH
jgi:hypothetical protein